MAAIEKLGESSSAPHQASGYASWRDRPNYGVPSSAILIATPAFAAGLMIGIARGARQAGLQFKAENAHRPPTTVRGWYFYNRSKNQRIISEGLRVGARYAVGIYGGTLAFVLLYEGLGWTREQIFGVKGKSSTKPDDVARGTLQRHTWRSGQAIFSDGLIAGTLSGIGAGLIYRLPRQPFLRAILIGAGCGSSFSVLQLTQGYLSAVKEEKDAADARARQLMEDEDIRQAVMAAIQAREAAGLLPKSESRQIAPPVRTVDDQPPHPSTNTKPVDKLLDGDQPSTVWERAKGWFGGQGGSREGS